jgi:hypothetical protein
MKVLRGLFFWALGPIPACFVGFSLEDEVE